MKYILLSFALYCATSGSAQTLLVQPFLQDAEPSAITIAWETSSLDSSLVQWGLTAALGNQIAGTSQVGLAATRIHHVHVTGLQPDTRYYYRVKTGAAISDVFDFITPPLKGSEKSFSLVAMSDMQQDNLNPTVFKEVCEEGVLGYMTTTQSEDLAANIAFVMIPGDLVDNGSDYLSWKNTFFKPSELLFSRVPVYPVLGNHEVNTATYFKYFDLPDNGTTGYEEHWWYKDYSNLRTIGMDSNTGYLLQEQLDWLDQVLADASADEHIDFVFAQLHHPHHSELWIAGNLDYTGEVIQRLETFTTQSGKPSMHFFGHTHAYSRGQSQDHRHVMVNVATAGGNIDYWNEYAQIDYPEYVVSQDEYGFVWVDVEAGADPKFRLKRISRGNENYDMANEIRDSFEIKRYNQAPQQPTAISPANGAILSPNCTTTFTANAYSDPENSAHGATQWQIATDPSFSNVVLDQWRQYENWYKNVDLQAGDDLTNEEVSALPENATLYWRVRYRNKNLTWSTWSTPISFSTTGSVATSGNLLKNGGAEDGTTSWVTTAGIFESLVSTECGSHDAYAGQRLFSAGGVCTDGAYGEAYQEIDVSAFAAPIMAGTAKARFGGYLRNWQGTDLPQYQLEFLDAAGMRIDSTPVYGDATGEWTLSTQVATLPAQCAAIRFFVMGTRQAGQDNDSYFDELFLKIDTTDCSPLISGLTTIPSQATQVTLSPNPTQSTANIHLQPFLGPVSFRMMDIMGKQVMTGELTKAVSPINLSRLPSGIYFLQVSGGGRIRVVKE